MRSPLSPHATEALALLILRFGCAWFIFVWAVNKLLAPQQYQNLVKWIDKVEIDLTTVMIVAAAAMSLPTVPLGKTVRAVPPCLESMDLRERHPMAVENQRRREANLINTPF